MATTTTFTTMIPTPQPKKPGPPVPPRPQQSSLLKTQQRDVSSTSSSTTTTKSSSATSQRLMSKVGLEQQPQILKKPIIANATSNSNNTTSATAAANSTSVTTSGGRTVIYKSPSLNLQKRQEERENRNEASTQTATTAITRTTSAASATTAAAANKVKLANGTQAPKPPLKLRKAPDVPTNFKPRITAPQPEVKETEAKLNKNNNTSSPDNNIVIVQSAQGVVTLNRHHSMGAASPQNKPSALAKDTRLSLGKADFERVGKIHVQQLQPTSQPLPKPRKIVKVPVATLDVEDTSSNSTNTTSSSTSSTNLHVNLFKRSKTSIENFTSRSNITTVNTNTTGSYLSGKTVEIKNNLKNAAERLFSEIMVNQQKQNALEATNTIITKHERAIQHQAEPMKQNNANNVTVVTTSKDYALNNDNNNCTRINITTTPAAGAGTPAAAAATNQIPNKLSANSHVRQVVSAFNSPEKKSAAFHEMLISELAAMRTRSCSMENLQTTQQQQLLPPQSPLSVKESSATIDKQFQNYKQFKTLENQLKVNNNKQQQQEQDQQKQQRSPPSPQQHQQLQNKQHQHHKLPANDDDIDADNIEDADGDIEEDLKKSLKVITAQNSPRKRTPSGCSSDSSPYGTERSARIRTSDWIEVGDNGKQVTLTSCHISLEDSGLEDEERMDEMSSSGVGDSWDSVKEAEQHHQQQQQQIQLQQQQAKRCRNVKRIMSINDLPPLPKSLSGINKMLASDSGLVSDVDTEIKNSKNNELLKNYENQKENNNNLNINNNNNNINSNNNNNALKDASDKFNNASVTTTTTTTATMATTTTSAATSTTTPLKEINGNETISEIPPAIPGSKLDTQIATLRKEMFGLRQLDLSLLSQLWALNDSIQEFRTMIQEQEQDDDETYSTHSRSPSPYDSVSSDAEDEILTLKSKVNRMELQNGNVITTQPKLTTKAYNADSEMIANQITTTSTTSSISSSSTTPTTPLTISALADQQKSQLLKPPVPKPLDVKPVPRMRSAPPPPPTHRKSQTAPPRPT